MSQLPRPAPTTPLADDLVNLVVVLTNGHVSAGPMTRAEASKHIRTWWDGRMWAKAPHMMDYSDLDKNARKHIANQNWLESSTVALNVGETCGENFASAAWAVSEVIGMYTYGVAPDPAEQERLRALKNINDAADRERREREESEGWRGSPDPDDEDEQEGLEE